MSEALHVGLVKTFINDWIYLGKGQDESYIYIRSLNGSEKGHKEHYPIGPYLSRPTNHKATLRSNLDNE